MIEKDHLTDIKINRL